MSNGKETGQAQTRPEEDSYQMAVDRFGDRPLKQWDAEGLLKIGEKLGKRLANVITTSQIRKFVDELQRIRHEQSGDFSKAVNQAKLTKIRLVYMIGSHKSPEGARALRAFERVFSYALERTKDAEDLKNLVRLVESVVAYHRYYDKSGRGD